MNTNSIENPSRESTVPDAISAITVGGFKSIRDEIEIEIRPLTILAGANSSGKSSVMQPLLLLKQTLEAGYDPGPLLLDGPNISFTSADQIFSSHREEGAALIFSVALKTRVLRSLCRIRFQRSGEPPGIEIHDMTFEIPHFHPPVTLRPGMTSEELEELLPNLREAAKETGPSRDFRVQPRWMVRRDRAFLEIGAVGDFEYLQREGEIPGAGDRRRESSEHLLRLGEIPVPTRLLSSHRELFWQTVSGILHVPGFRGRPRRVYPWTPPTARLIGEFESYVAGLVAHWQDHKPHKASKLREWLARLHLGRDIRAKVIGQTMVELKINLGGEQGREEWFDLADVGLGVSQTLPLLVALLQAMERPGTAVYVEQPETHLHPRAQVAMAEILAEAAQEGVCVIAETHSSLLLLAFQTLVAEGKVNCSLAKFHWFTLDEHSNTKITSASLDETGAFEEEWPEDFAAVEMRVENRFLDAVEQRHMSQ